MKLGIISDSHDNLANLEIALNYFTKNKINTLIHAGDLCFADTLKFVLKNFSGKLFLVGGNGDENQAVFEKLEKENNNFKYFPEIGEIKIKNYVIGFVHEPDRLNKLAETEKYNILIYGHTHKPWEKIIITKKKFKRVQVLNPGTLAGLFAKATFAVYDTDTRQAQLIILQQLLKEYAPKD